MTYFAPRQGIFAVIIVVSLSLHLLFFVLNQSHYLNQQYRNIAQYNANVIAQEISTALQVKDNVSIGVILDRHIKEETIDFIGVYDEKDTLVAPIGTQGNGTIINTPVTVNNHVWGHVDVQTKPINRALIFSDNWLYLVSVLALHIALFLIYGYVARPTQGMLKKIHEDTRLRLLSQGLLSNEPSPTAEALTPVAINPAVSTAISADNGTADETSTTDTSTPPLPSAENLPFISLVAVQIQFEDPNQLLGAVSHHTKSAYFNLCNQLLAKAIGELLKLTVLSGVSLYALNDYDDNGTTVLLKADNRHAKVTTAGVMLARLIIMLNQIVYDKHRELKRFCLTTRAMVSDFDRQKDLTQVAKRHKERVLILVPEAGMTEVKSYATFAPLTKPSTVSERQAQYLKLVSESTAERLTQVRDAVLLSE